MKNSPPDATVGPCSICRYWTCDTDAGAGPGCRCFVNNQVWGGNDGQCHCLPLEAAHNQVFWSDMCTAPCTSFADWCHDPTWGWSCVTGFCGNVKQIATGMIMCGGFAKLPSAVTTLAGGTIAPITTLAGGSTTAATGGAAKGQ